MTRVLALLVVFFASPLVMLSAHGDEASPDEALAQLLTEARAGLPEACEEPGADLLTRVLCSGALRVGIRFNYPLFATTVDEERIGYDVDVARQIATRLGVNPVWVYVRAATRISMLAEGRVDLVVATMGHNTRRDAEARFIRPHYYSSQTIFVGPSGTRIESWDDLPARSVCVTIGNYSNAHLVSQGARLMLFDDGSRLPQGLLDETCFLAAQDDSFFASYLADPDFAARFEPKFGFDPVPWGMAVPKDHGERLAEAIELISQIMHRDGDFVAIAREHGVVTTFLEEQQDIWRRPSCASAAAIRDPTCIRPPLDATLPRTTIAPLVEATLGWLEAHLGIRLTLPMLTSVPAWELFEAGVVNSLVLVIGALAATLAFALLIGAASAATTPLLRAPAWVLVVTLQSSPVVLTLVVAAAIAHALFTYSPAVALGSAIVALGLMNGCNAAQSIGEAADSVRAEGGDGRGLTPALFGAAVGRSTTQILSFLVNAAKGTPIASFTGAPELLSALTDITSFAAGRAATYTVVLLFYVAVVVVVVWACERARSWLEPTRPPS
ncbi:MAG: transporter substrate-binding domain-containing protein [Pseudomonadota bacterium]